MDWIVHWVAKCRTRLSDFYFHFRAFLVAQTVKHLPAMREIWVQPLGQEDPLEKEMAIHSSTLAWRVPWMEKPGRSLVHGVAKSQILPSDFTFTFILFF